jgi:hypothetical protein
MLMNEMLKTLGMSIEELVALASEADKVLELPCILQEIQDQCPSFGATIVCCGLCDHAASDHNLLHAAFSTNVAHCYSDDVTRSSVLPMSELGSYVVFRHDGYPYSDNIVSLEKIGSLDTGKK